MMASSWPRAKSRSDDFACAVRHRGDRAAAVGFGHERARRSSPAAAATSRRVTAGANAGSPITPMSIDERSVPAILRSAL